MNDRIKLAEAMFPNREIRVHSQGIVGYNLPNGTFFNFNPFTDANDDYAVLEWMRGHEDWEKFRESIAYHMWNFLEDYKVGNHARVALRVLSGD